MRIMMMVWLAWSAHAGPTNELAGVTINAPIDVAGWERSDETYSRVVNFLGYPAVLTMELKDGRASGVALAFLVAHPVTGGISAQQPGLTVSSSPGQKAEEIAAAIRARLALDGFVRTPGVADPGHPQVEHYCATGNRERTLYVRPEEPGSLYLVFLGAPYPSSCP